MINSVSHTPGRPFPPRILAERRLSEAEQSAPPSLDVSRVTAPASYREPHQAVAFTESFDRQLGISAEMAKEKRELMAESSHAFFRASPALFYHDLQSTYSESSRLLPEVAPRLAIVGDAHLLNAGTFRGPDGKTVWGLNDFDQAEIGSPEWDLERMGTSLYLAARSGGLSSQDSLALVRMMGSAYLESLGQPGPAFLHREETAGRVADLIDKAGSKDRTKFLDKWTTSERKSLHRNEDLVEPDPARRAELLAALQASFPEQTVLDIASKPHSGGSTRGLERYYTLIENPGSDPWILEVKAVLPTPVQVPDGDLRRGDGQKILDIQRQMGSPVDHRHRAFRLGELAFFTREREPEKDALKDKAKNLTDLAPLLGKVLARAHTSSGADIRGWVAGRDGELLDNLESFSQSYARQVESDYREFTAKYPPVQDSSLPAGTATGDANLPSHDGFFLR